MSGYPKVAIRYGNALMSLAKERNEVTKICTEMKDFGRIYDEVPEFKAMLRSPVIRSDVKLKAIFTVFPALSELSKAFISKLTNGKREKFLGEIAKSFIADFNVENGIVNAIVESAIPLNDDLRKEVRSLILNSPAFKNNKEVYLTEKVNPELLGGFLITVNDNQIDTSYSTKITELRRGFTKNLYVKEF